MKEGKQLALFSLMVMAIVAFICYACITYCEDVSVRSGRLVRGTVASVSSRTVVLSTDYGPVTVSRKNLIPNIKEGDLVIIERRRVNEGK